MLLAYEVTRDLPLETIEIETPLTTMQAPQIAGKKLVLAPILRAVGFLDGMLSLVPSARVAHIRLYRDPDPSRPWSTISRHRPIWPTAWSWSRPDARDGEFRGRSHRPPEGARRKGSAVRLPARGAEGIERFRGTHPDVPIWTAAIDERLNDHGYIVPGLGDAGDRMYGTR